MFFFLGFSSFFYGCPRVFYNIFLGFSMVLFHFFLVLRTFGV